MHAVWESGGWLAIRDIRARMDYPPVAYTTVATVVGILCGKGLLRRRSGRGERPDPRASRYRAARPASEHIGTLIAALLDQSPEPGTTLAYALAIARTASLTSSARRGVCHHHDA